jgi:NADH:ubiquinone oxidoreductase subunit 2 (subunit N)
MSGNEVLWFGHITEINMLSNIIKSIKLFILDFYNLGGEFWILFAVICGLLIIAGSDVVQKNNRIVDKRKRVSFVTLHSATASLVVLLIGFIAYTVVLKHYYGWCGDNVRVLFENFNGNLLHTQYTFFFKTLITISTIVILSNSKQYLKYHNKSLMEFPVLILLSIFFLFILLSSDDLLVAFIAIVGFSLNTYVLILLDSHNHVSREASIKYYYLSAFSSGLIAFSALLTYLVFLSTNFTEIAWFLQTWDFSGHTPILTITVYFLTFGLLFKLAAFPCHLWAAAVYEGCPQPILAFFILPLKIGIFGFVANIYIYVLKDLHYI